MEDHDTPLSGRVGCQRYSHSIHAEITGAIGRVNFGRVVVAVTGLSFGCLQQCPPLIQFILHATNNIPNFFDADI